MSVSFKTLANFTLNGAAQLPFSSMAIPQAVQVIIHSLSTNAGVSYVGDSSVATNRGAPIAAGGTLVLGPFQGKSGGNEALALESMYVIGTNNDKLNITYIIKG